MRRVLKWAVIVLAVVLVAGASAAGVYRWNNVTAFDRGMKPVWDAGFAEKDARVAGQTIHYAEGPDNGPALLLIHGQLMDWASFYPVLPDLAKSFHVYAVDVYGHGGSSHDPALYTNVRLGADLVSFVKQVVGRPTIVSGHSSGGLIATWMAANAPEWVTGAVLEDPPLLATALPRAKTTWNWVDLASTCHSFLASGETDFVAYSFVHARFWQFFNGGEKGMIDEGLAYHAANPGKPIVLAWMPPSVNEVFRATPTYDPRFGEAFYTDSWDAGWDQADTMARITVPVTYLHSQVSVGADGILQGATTNEEAARIHALSPTSVMIQTTTGHNIHGEDPAGFVKAVTELAARARR